MHISRLDLNLLRLFAAVYSAGSVSRAASVLNLSQPAVSHALNRLRDQIGDPLFVRRGQGLAPTATAHKLIEPIRKALREIEVAIGNVRDFDPALADMRFHMGFNALIEEPIFSAIAGAIMPYAPGIGLESVRYTRSDMAMALASAQLDAIVDVELPVPEGVHCRTIWSGTIVALAAADHPFFHGGREVTLDDYMAARHIIVSTRPRGTSLEDIALARVTEQQRTVAARCQLVSSALQLLRQSDLVLTVATGFIDEAKLGPDVRIFAFPVTMPPVAIQLYWHANSDVDQAHLWFRERIFEQFASRTGAGLAPAW